MAIPKFDSDVAIISKLGDYPRADDALSPDEFKAKFDAAAILIKDYINNVLIKNLDELVDVQALLDSILDTTLSKSDKAAAAKATGDALTKAVAGRRMDVAKIFELTLRSGDFVFGDTTAAKATLTTANTVRVTGFSCIAQGNLAEIAKGSYTDLTYENCPVGSYRNDLICGRISRTADGTETQSIVLIKGAELASAGADPAHNGGNLNKSGAVTRDVPLYRLKLHGSDVSLERVYTGWTGIAARQSENAILYAANWQDGYQTVNVSGVTADNNVFISVPETGFEAYTDAEIRCVEQSAGKLKFKCESTPSGDITVGVLTIS